MKMKLLLSVLAGLALGFLAGYAWRGLPLHSVAAEGLLQYEKPQHPAVTPLYPPGHYVVSRVYVHGATDEMIGKRVILNGSLGVQKHPETSAYPALQDENIVIGNELPNEASQAIGADAPQPER
jgi:hypothetical protein